MTANDASKKITASRSFMDKVSGTIESRDSLVCVGLDPDLSRFPDSVKTGRSTGAAIVEFNKWIIESTVEIAAAYKPQLAMYMQYGPEGSRLCWKPGP